MLIMGGKWLRVVLATQNSIAGQWSNFVVLVFELVCLLQFFEGG